MANFIDDGNPGIAVSTNGINYDIIPTGAETIIGGTFKVNSGWNGDGQSGTPGVNYPYRTTTQLVITHGEKIYKFELQDLKGGALVAFNTGTQQDLADAIALVKTW